MHSGSCTGGAEKLKTALSGWLRRRLEVSQSPAIDETGGGREALQVAAKKLSSVESVWRS